MEVVLCCYYVILVSSVYFGVQYTMAVNAITFAVLLCLEWKNRKQRNYTLNKLLLLYIAWWIYLIVINVFRKNLFEIGELKIIIDLIFLKVLTAINTLVLVKNSNKVKVLLTFRNMTIFFLLYGGIEYIFNFSIMDIIQVCRDRRLQTIFLNPIIYGTYLVFIWSIALAYPFQNKKFDFGYKILLVVNLLLTLSRSSWIPFAVITLFYVVSILNNGELKERIDSWKQEKGRNKIIAQISIAVVAVGGIIFAYKESLISAGQSVLQRINIVDMLQSQAFLARIGNIVNVIKDYIVNGTWGSRIFGKGMLEARKVVAANPVAGWQDAVDNQYVTCLYDYGMIELILLVCIFISILRYCRVICDKKITRMLLFMLINVVLGMFFYEMLEWSATIVIFTIMVGIATMEYTDSKKEKIGNV